MPRFTGHVALVTGGAHGIGRAIVEDKVQRPAGERAVRWLLKEGLTSPLFGPAMKLGQALRPLVPGSLKDKVPAKAPPRSRSSRAWTP